MKNFSIQADLPQEMAKPLVAPQPEKPAPVAQNRYEPREEPSSTDRNFSFWPLFSASRTKPTSDNGTNYTARTGFGGGLLISYSPAKDFDIQTGAEYFLRRFNINGGISGTSQLNTKNIKIPLMFWYKLPFQTELGAGAAYNMNVGTPDLSGTAVGLDSLGLSSTDTSLEFSIRQAVEFCTNWSVFVALRYSLGISNPLTSNVAGLADTSFHYNAMGVALGVKYAAF